MSTPLTHEDLIADAAGSRLQELGVSLDPGIPYRMETMFPRLEGWGSGGAIRRKVKIIRQVEPLLREMLHAGEEVLYIAKGVQYSLAEHYFIGLWAMSINQTVFVLTSARLIMLRTNGKGRPKQTFWMIYYSQIARFKSNWIGMLELKLEDGRKLTFSSFPKLDRQQMPQVFEQALAAYREVGFDPDVTQSLENLCSYCYSRVPRDEYECPDCRALFWKPSAVALRSLIFPSWGDMVLKHYLIAGVELFGYLGTWIVVGAMLFAALTQQHAEVLLIFAAAILVVVHGVDAAVTYFVARKGLHPRQPPPASHEVI